MTQARLKEVLRYNRRTGMFKWRKKHNDAPGHINDYGYLKLHFGGISIYAHRAAWLYVHGVLPCGTIDHVNHVRLDNRIVNLRVCSIRENVRYQQLHKDNRSGFKGVDWVAHRGKWRARIVVAREPIHLGAAFQTAKAAARAYDAAATKHFGAFAKTNASLGLL